ncbi:MAG: hypothetical protein EOM02_01980 [Synergistales bacterium]|nr:hypothetical protein [Synergistales bacterium]
MDSKEVSTCPFCGVGRALPVYWGYLPFDLAYLVERGEALYGGPNLPGQDSCLWGCDRCGARW